MTLVLPGVYARLNLPALAGKSLSFQNILENNKKVKTGLVILLYTLSQRKRRLEVKWSVMKRGLVGSREWVWDD